MDIVVKVPDSHKQENVKDLEFKFNLDGTVEALMNKIPIKYPKDRQILKIHGVDLTLEKDGQTRVKDVENGIIYFDTELVFQLILGDSSGTKTVPPPSVTKPASGTIEEKSPKTGTPSSGYLIVLYVICLISITAAVLGCYKLGNNPKRQLLSLMASLSGLIVGTSALIAAGKKPLHAKSFALCALFVFLVLAATATSLAFTKYGSGDIKSEDVIAVKIVQEVSAAEITKLNDAASHPPSLLMMGLVTGVITALVFDFCG
eukprot:812889_1